MNDIMDATRDYLLTQAGVTALVGNRIYYGNLPQSATTEAIVLELQNVSVMDRSLGDGGSLYNASINVVLYTDTHAERAALGSEVDTAMHHISGTWGGVTVDSSSVEYAHDSVDPPRDGSEQFRQVRVLFCTVIFR